MKRFKPLVILLMIVSLSLTFLYGWMNRSLAVESIVTTQRPQVRALTSGVDIKPILTVGESLQTENGRTYQMAGIPDGMGAYDNKNGTFTVLLNHELSAPTNLSDARVSKLQLSKRDPKVLNVTGGRYLINGTEGYKRFCSATYVDRKEGFTTPVFLTNEEDTTSKFGGISLAVNPINGQIKNLPWIGYYAHENTIGVPGFKQKVVVLSTEDDAPGHLFMYIGRNQADILNGRGQLYVFKASNASSPSDFHKGDTVEGNFIPVSQQENQNFTTLRKAVTDKGALFFARLEDIAYDLNSPNVLYFASTGRSRFVDPKTGQPYDAKGRIYKMTLDPQDPTRVVALEVLIEGDKGDPVLNPDNIAVSDRVLMIQEDINTEFKGQRPGRIWQYDLQNKSLTAVAELDQTDPSGNPIPGDSPGEWESSGIINMANILGPNKWLVNVQAHTLSTPQFGGQDESGQILLMEVPNSASRINRMGTPKLQKRPNKVNQRRNRRAVED
jgi:Bacterial protein of unknown function (DUF839)